MSCGGSSVEVVWIGVNFIYELIDATQQMNNTTLKPCVPYHELYRDPSSHWITITVFSFIYSVIFLFGLIGNGAVIILTAKHRSLQTVQNIFILNLCIADIILIFLSVSLTPVTHIYKQWFFGAFLCRVVGGTQAVGMFISSFSLCAIAVDRYFRLTTSPARQLTRKGAVRVTYAFWLMSLFFTLPYIFHMRMKQYKHRNICGSFCTEKWPTVTSKRIYTIAVLTIQCVLPFTVILICYRALFAFLRKRAMTRMKTIAHQTIVLAATAGTENSHQLSHLVDQKRRVLSQKRRATILLVLVTSIFAFTTLPHNVISLLTEFDNDWGLAMISVVTNPILYAFLNPEFRELVLNWLQLLIPLRRGAAPPTQLSSLFTWRTAEC
ncbi:G-PROTEIN-RECEP-F1-2 domain-containing protein [Aphelenchoides besseyi]|nr:G-PROTEIN-RECEP-F1-2 domain-containing protein [Aphelenchoides besseyi]